MSNYYNNDSNDNNGYENPYNSWESNNEYYDDGYYDNENQRKNNRNVGKRFGQLSKFIKKSGLKIIAINTTLALFFYRFKTYAELLGIKNNFSYNDNGSLYYRNMFLVVYITSTILYYFFKSFKRKTNIFLLLSMVLSLVIYAILPFTYNIQYSEKGLEINKVIYHKTIPYSEFKEVNFQTHTIKNALGTTGSIDCIRVTVTFMDDKLLLSNDLKLDPTILITSIDKFERLEKKFPSAKANYSLTDENFNTKNVSKQEFHAEVEKYKPYIANKPSQLDILANQKVGNKFDKWVYRTFINNK